MRHPGRFVNNPAELAGEHYGLGRTPLRLKYRLKSREKPVKKLIPSLLAALLLVGLTWESPDVAQSSGPDSDLLLIQADAIREAVLNGTPEEFFNKLAPWLQGRAKLFRERLPRELDAILSKSPETERNEERSRLEKKLLTRLQKLDPQNTLGIESYEDYFELKAPQLVALETGQLRVHYDESAKDAREASWYEVDRTVYTTSESKKLVNRGREFERVCGEITFMDEFDHVFVVEAVAAGNGWHIVRAGGDFGRRECDTEGCPVLSDPFEEYVERSVRDAKRVEGEQLLASARDYCRDTYSEDKSPPTKLSDGTELDTYEGAYFRIRDTIYRKPDMLRGAIVAEPVDDEDLGWAVLYFNYEGSDSEIKWYDKEGNLKAALNAFQTAK